MFLHFVWLNSQCSPFLFLSQCSWCMPPTTIQCLWECMPPPTPFNARKCTCLPLPFNALEDALHPAFKSLDAYLPPPFHLDSETHLTSCCKSHFHLIRFCFIYFDFLIITTMRKNYSLVSHVLFISQHCSPILACSSYQKSMNFSHDSVKSVGTWTYKWNIVGYLTIPSSCSETTQAKRRQATPLTYRSSSKAI